MRVGVLVFMLVAICGTRATAQISVEEAQRRLAERQSRRVAQSRPATNPAAPAGIAAESPSDPDRDHALHEAWQKLMARQYDEAAKRFSAVLATQPSNGSALQGRAICNYELSRYKPAADDAEKAIQFSRANPATSRQATLVAACACVATNLPTRAVRIALDALKAEEKAGVLDEEMQDVLGTAIWRCKADTRGLPLVRDAGKYYVQYDLKLAHERDGSHPKYIGFDVKNLNEKNGAVRRWGTQWLAADDAEARWATYATAVSARDAAAGDVATAVQNRQKAERFYEEMHDLKNPHTLIDINASYDMLQQASQVEAGARQTLATADKYLAAVESPPFPLKPEPSWAEPGVPPPTSQPSKLDAPNR